MRRIYTSMNSAQVALEVPESWGHFRALWVIRLIELLLGTRFKVALSTDLLIAPDGQWCLDRKENK